MTHNILNTPEGLYVFGDNNHGQLGLVSRYVSPTNIPKKLKFFNNNFEIISVHHGGYRTIINTTKGLYVFGYNLHGQLGLGHCEDREQPTKLKFSHKIISIHCGKYHTIINTTDGLYVFGNNYGGQLGLGDTKPRKIPTKLDFFHNLEIISIDCGEKHTVINTTDGLYVFGNNDCGQLGLGDKIDRRTPTKLNFFTDTTSTLEIISIHCGNNYTIINTSNGLYVFGGNDFGQLGLGHRNDNNRPTKLGSLGEGLEIISIHCGEFHTIINTIDGLYVFGLNIYGQLGLGDRTNRREPTKLQFENRDLEILSIYCGENYTMVNTTDGLYVFGSNYYGQLGLGDKVNQYTPTKLEFPHEILPNHLEKRFKNTKSTNSCS